MRDEVIQGLMLFFSLVLASVIVSGCLADFHRYQMQRVAIENGYEQTVVDGKVVWVKGDAPE